MKIITLTSENYLGHTLLLLESLRIWHPDTSVAVYAISTDWTQQATAALESHGAQVIPIDELRGDAEHSHTNRIALKLDVFITQTEPFLYVDSDILVLRSLAGAFEQIQGGGWLTVHDHECFSAYKPDDIAPMLELTANQARYRTFNAGVLGWNPASSPEHRDIFVQAKQWATTLPPVHACGEVDGSAYERRSGDQALLNLAWLKTHGIQPPHMGYQYNTGVLEGGVFSLSACILHLCGSVRPELGPDKLSNHQRIWQTWPKGISFTPLEETPFWAQTQPHPWLWLNQCTHPRHRRFVKHMRSESKSLSADGSILVDNAYQWFLLDRGVRHCISRYWEAQRDRFAQLLHLPTYHLPGHGGKQPPRRSHMQEITHHLRSILPI